MAKVLVERPRVGSRMRSTPRKGYVRAVRRALASDDSGAIREGMKVRSGQGKWFNEHLGPLRRYLDSQVGRPWRKVHSEISRHVDRGNVVQKHILTHLFEYVVTDPVLIDGVVHYPPHQRGRCAPIVGRHAWFVCPKSGLLKRAPQCVRRVRSGCLAERHWISRDQFCVRTAAGCILVTVRPIDESATGWHDAYLGRFVHRFAIDDLTSMYGKAVHAVAVRLLTKAELYRLPIPIDVIRPIVQNRV